jgi:hypothetical protein
MNSIARYSGDLVDFTAGNDGARLLLFATLHSLTSVGHRALCLLLWRAPIPISAASDGELGKVGFSKYVLQRMSGFEGHADFMVLILPTPPGSFRTYSAAKAQSTCAIPTQRG